MAKKYWDGEFDINTDWGGDESTNNLPLPGSAVQKVVKDKLNELDKGKVGYIFEDTDLGKVYFSATKEAHEAGIHMGSVNSTPIYSMDLLADVNNKNMFLSNDTKKEYVWYFKTNFIADESLYVENVTVEYTIQNESEGKQTTYSTVIESNADVKNDNYTKVVMNLDEYLSNGTSLLTIVVRGLKTKQERTLQTRINIITLDIEDATDFSKPFDTRFIANVDITCTRNQNYFFEYRIDGGEFTTDATLRLGKGSKERVAFDILLNEIAEGKHVFEYRLFVKIDTDIAPYYTKTQRIEFIKGTAVQFNEPQILIFSTYDNDEVVEAEDGNLIINGISQYIPYSLKYAIYNSDVASTNVEFYDVTNGESAPITDTVYNNIFAEYNIQAIESGAKKIKIITKDVENEITNGNGRIIYLNVDKSALGIGIYDTNLRVDFNSIGKSNNSIDKTSWISNVGNGRFINSATFNETFDWSQGWTDNGLVISEGSEVVFDYAPFPQQKEQASTEEANEYVGGEKAYTFEIEFMTQNVTDEEAVVCDMIDESTGKEHRCGLQITGSEIKFTTPNGNSVSTRFKAEEMNRATIIIRPKKSNSGIFKGLVELYVNGVLSNIAKYDENEKFEVFGRDEIGNAISKKLTFRGVEGADIVIKYIRAYNGAMEADDVVNNYILYRTSSKEMLDLYNKNNVINDAGTITPESMIKLGNIPILIFIGRTNANELATGDGNETGDEEYKPGAIDANEENWYQTLENTTNKKKDIDMDVIYYNPLDKTKNFKFVKAYITPQGTSSMYYPKKNYRIYTQKNKDTRCFFSNEEAGVLEFEDMMKWHFGEDVDSLNKSGADERKWEKWRGTKNYKKRLYSFKDNSQPVKCWCLKADFAETSSSHNTGVARLWGETLKESTVTFGDKQIPVFKTNAQATIENKYIDKRDEMPDVRTTIDGFPIVVFGARSYGEEMVFLGQYNFNNDKSTESVFGFCDIDNVDKLTDQGKNTETGEVTEVVHTLDEMLDKYMTCVETLDNGNVLANFNSMVDNDTEWDDAWENAFEFRYPEIPEGPDEVDYQDKNGNWIDKEGYDADLKEFEEEILPYWKNTHLKPFKHFAQWIYDTRWCDVNGNLLPGITSEEAALRKEKFATEKWDHLDVWKVAAYYVYAMRFGAVDQIVKNSMLTSEGPFARDVNGNKGGFWDTTDVTSENYGKYYKWYYINYDNDTVMGVKNDGSLAYGPEITRQSTEGGNNNPIYAGSTSTLWNNLDADEEFQEIVRRADQGISKTMTYKKAIEMFDVEQVGKWCERIYNKDAEYKYISPYVGDWTYTGEDEGVENFTDKLFMLQGSRTAHRRWWLSKRFNLFDGKWGSGDFPTKYIEVKCDYSSIGDKFSAVAGANAYFGYQINNKTFGSPEGGETEEYKAGSTINWQLFKNIQIGDPIGIYGSTDMLELNLMGLSKNLSSVLFYFGNNTDISNKLERLYLSVPDELMLANASYEVYSDDEEGTVNGKTGFEKLKADYPDILETDFDENGKYPTSDTEIDATLPNAPLFYRTPVEVSEGVFVYIYFAKKTNGLRNYSCKSFAFDALDKLQILKMAGYMSIPSLSLTKNQFITSVDVRYSSVGSITFAEGARISELSASTALNTLSFTRCNNIKLSNIMIDNVPLEKNGGTYLTTISIDNSDGLNHDSDKFKTFMLKWIKGGAGYQSNPNRSLTLRGVRWTSITIKDIETIREFMFGDSNGANKAKYCEISGIFEMSSDNLSREDIEIIEKFQKETGITVRIPYPNILINAPKEIVAGNKVVIGSEIFSDAESIMENYVISYTFVEEIFEDMDGMLKDYHDGRRYLPIDAEKIRNNTIRLTSNTDKTATLSTDEVILGEDTSTLMAVILRYEGNTKFDIVPLTIKDPTYAISGYTDGVASLNEVNKKYEYNLVLTSNKGEEPIGTVDIEWNIEGDGLSYIAESGISEDGKVLTLTTKDTLPDLDVLAGDIKITANVINYNSISYPNFIVQKDILVLNDSIILTYASNPVVMGVFSAMVGDARFITKEEASSFTSIDNLFTNLTSDRDWSFEEFRYFNNPEFTTLNDNAFAGTRLTSIIFPENITTLGIGVFENCKKLKTVELTENIVTLPKRTFAKCSNLERFILPNSVQTIEEYAFGGANIEKILFKNGKTDIAKAIYVDEYAMLNTIKNNAFEDEGEGGWKVSKDGNLKTTNILNEVSLPDKLVLAEDTYNFLLSSKLAKINLVEKLVEENKTFIFDNNILYAGTTRERVVRALPVRNNNYVDTVELPITTGVYNYAFYACNTIRKVVFGESLDGYGLGEGVFFNSKVEEVDLSLSNKLKALNSFTFYNANDLVDVKLPMEGILSSLGSLLFVNNTKLTKLELPDSIVTVKGRNDEFDSNYSYMIRNCGIETFKLPESLITTGMYFLNNCPNLKTFTYSKHFDIKSTYALVTSCPSLEEIILPIFTTTAKEKCWYVYSDKHIISGPYTSQTEADAMAQLYDTNRPTNYKKVYSVKEYTPGEIVVNYDFYTKGRVTTFEDCPNVMKYTFNENESNNIFTTEDSGVSIIKIAMFNEDTMTIVPCPKTLVKVAYATPNYQVGDDIVKLEDGVFAHCSHITDINITDKVTSLGAGLFAYMDSLKNVQIYPISAITTEMFCNSGIEEFVIPDSVVKINESAFAGTKLKKIVIPSNVTRIEKGAFQGCNNVSSLEVLSRNLSYVGWNVFNGCLNLSKIILMPINAPTLDYNNKYYTSVSALPAKDVFEYHPFGYYIGVIAGTNSAADKYLYLPYNYSGYDTEIWQKPLLDMRSGYSNFQIKYLQLNSNISIKGDCLTGLEMVYMKQESKDSIESIPVSNNSFIIVISDTDIIYDNELITLYSDANCNTKIAEFNTCFGKDEYDLNNGIVMGAMSNIALFNTNLYANETVNNVDDSNVEMANITKREYEILQAKINQLMKLLNKK